jgi:hypothetical protein
VLGKLDHGVQARCGAAHGEPGQLGGQRGEEHGALPNPRELKATRVLAMTLDESSATVRTGPPEDDPEDYDVPVWAGVIPLHTSAGTPIADPRTPPEVTPSGAITRWMPDRVVK